MSVTLLVLGVIAPIGAIDVLYYHFHRFRLFERDASVAEEVTHLVRQATFLAVVLLLASGARSGLVDHALLALIGLDVVNSVADVLLEPRSRAELGGLPPGEYLLHFLGTLGSGVAAASYLFERRALPLPPAPHWQVALLVPAGVLLLAVELTLFARARLRRSAGRLHPTPDHQTGRDASA